MKNCTSFYFADMREILFFLFCFLSKYYTLILEYLVRLAKTSIMIFAYFLLYELNDGNLSEARTLSPISVYVRSQIQVLIESP
jgi:hypothetical protein